MSYEHVTWEQDGGVGRLTLNRPDSLNAWTEDFGVELKQVITVDAADESVRKAADPLAVARAGAADLLVVKAQPLGGVAASSDGGVAQGWE